ncbi:translation initiation factor IF-2-like [Tympanuchus pallidicinctus]|uniref:translation initiation factor IF-2-like n=1 Tax=Tympanuchus pallidicinctus TaxID=109042 RepID=UPI0022875AAE|nr:translation initiation factor IF-2-like [Tympanuchus pallidicinctus]
MALPPGGDPCPGPTPGLSQPHRPGFVPAGRPVPPPALPRPPSSAGSASTLEAGPGGSDSGAGTRNGTRRGLSASPSPCQHGKDAEISSRRRPRAAPAPAGLSEGKSPHRSHRSHPAAATAGNGGQGAAGTAGRQPYGSTLRIQGEMCPARTWCCGFAATNLGMGPGDGRCSCNPSVTQRWDCTHIPPGMLQSLLDAEQGFADCIPQTQCWIPLG